MNLLLSEIFFKTKSGFKNEFCLFFSYITEMPGLISKTGDFNFVCGIAENESVFMGMFTEELICFLLNTLLLIVAYLYPLLAVVSLP